MKKKIIIGIFSVLILITIIAFSILMINDYNHAIEIDDPFASLGVVIALFLGGCVVIYELDLFYTVYYFLVRPKTKLKSILNIFAHLCLVLIGVYTLLPVILSYLGVWIDIYRAIVPLFLFLKYVVLRMSYLFVADSSFVQELDIMKLDLQQVTDITLGAVRVTEEVDGFHFYRFTEEQLKLYVGRNPDFDKKVLSTTGVRLSFRTDSEKLFLKIGVKLGANRTYFAMDIFVNGEMVDSIANFENGEELSKTDYASVQLPLGDFEKEVFLGEGEKTVRIDLPWSMQTTIQEIALTEGATLEPVKPAKKMLVFGDSITQGYDALYPSNKYISRLAKHLRAEEYNKAIGGEVFFPELAATKETFTPDYIVVAYGTNDWNLAESKEQFLQRCEDFFQNLAETYSNTPVLAITPTWRGDWQQLRPTGAFESVDRLIRGAAEHYENVTVVSGIHFIEHDPLLFADRRLHPNDEGFSQYFENLVKELEKN